MSDADFAEGVRRSAEFMRLHEDEPNEFIPKARCCADCETRGYEEDDSAFRCKADCGEWLCAECAEVWPTCHQCECDRAEAVAAEAARLETEIEQRKESLLRTMNL